MGWSVTMLMAVLAMHLGTSQGQDSLGQSSAQRGELFISALTASWRNGTVSSLQLPGGLVDLKDAIFPDFPDTPVGAVIGRLTVKPDGTDRLIFDMGQRPFAPKPLTYSTSYVIENADFVNHCTARLKYAPAFGIILATAGTMVGLLNTSRTAQDLTLRHSRIFTSTADISMTFYVFVTSRSPFTQTIPYATILLGASPKYMVNISSTTAYQVVYSTISIPSGIFYNTSMQSIDDPNLDLPIDLALLAPRYCVTGELMPLNVVHTPNTTTAPGWLSDDTATFISAVQQAAACSGNLTCNPFGAHAMVHLAGNASFAGMPQAASPRNISGVLLLVGPFNDVPSMRVSATLDLANGTNLWRLVSGSSLLLWQMTLTGLAARPIPGVDASNAVVSSALPLWAITLPKPQGFFVSVIQIFVNNCTWVLPAEDFYALWQYARIQTAALACGLTADSVPPLLAPGIALLLAGATMKVAPGGLDSDGSFLVLDSFVGRGVNAVAFRLLPATPLAPSVLQQAPPDVCRTSISGVSDVTAHSGGGDSDGAAVMKLGVGLGVGLGAGVLLVLLGLTAWLHKSSDKYRPLVPPQSAEHVVCCTVLPIKTTPGLDSIRPPALICSHLNSSVLRPPASSLAQLVRGAEVENHSTISAASTKDISSSLAFMSVVSDHNQAVEVAAAAIGPACVANQVTITGVLGVGAGGSVYTGLWRGLPVAIKTVCFRNAQTAHGKHPRPVMEAAIAASVGHRNVVALYHYDIVPIRAVHADDANSTLQIIVEPDVHWETDEATDNPHTDYKLYMVMELCGCTLTSAFDNSALHDELGPIWESILDLMLDVARGLTHLHGKNIIHGDIKPANILLQSKPDSTTEVVAKLADFGLATVLDATVSHVSGLRVGTPYYTAPEVVQTGRMSVAADMFSFGVVAWQLITGLRPYVASGGITLGDSPGDTRPNPDFPHMAASTPVALQHLVHSCLLKEPKARPSSLAAVQCIEAFQASQGQLSLSAMQQNCPVGVAPGVG